MKDRFYNFINFLSSELHLFEYMFYILFIGIMFGLYDYCHYSIRFLEYSCIFVIACAFMNTWEIKARSYKKKKDVNENEKHI